MEFHESLWCYTCDKPTSHEVRFRSDPEFIGKLLVCHDCGETVMERLGGPECGDC